MEAQAGLGAPGFSELHWVLQVVLQSAGWRGRKSVQVDLAQRPRVCLPTRCHWQPVFKPRTHGSFRDSGHAVLVATGHHAVGYLKDNTWEMFLVSCRKTTGCRPITGLCLKLRWLSTGHCFSARLSPTGKWNQCPSLACGEDYERISQLSVVKDLKNSYSVSSKSS